MFSICNSKKFAKINSEFLFYYLIKYIIGELGGICTIQFKIVLYNDFNFFSLYVLKPFEKTKLTKCKCSVATLLTNEFMAYFFGLFYTFLSEKHRNIFCKNIV